MNTAAARFGSWLDTVCAALTALAFAGGAAFFLWLGQHRLLALDEGYYLYAAKLVLAGKLPARDFFYPQMPLLPYVYGAWMSVWGVTWSAARGFSALCGVLLALLVYVDVRVRHGQYVALFGVVLFFTSAMVFPWYTVAKSYAFPHLVLFLSWVLVRWPAPVPPLRSALAGLCFGVAVGCRLYLVALAPVLLVLLYANAAGRERGRVLLSFIAASCAPLVPILFIFLQDPDAFWFNNLGYHLGRFGYDNLSSMAQKRRVLLALFGLSRDWYGGQFAVLLWTVLGFGLWKLVRRRTVDVNVVAVIVLLVVSALPSPTYPQYFNLLAPFVVCAFCEVVDQLARTLGRRVAYAAIAFLVLYISTVPRDVRRFVETGVGLPAMGTTEDAHESRIEFVREVSRSIDDLARPGEPVLAFWPGYLLESHAGSIPGAESQFSSEAANQLTPDECARYHVLSLENMMDLLRSKQVRLFVVRGKVKRLFHEEDLGIHPAKTLGSVAIYTTE